MMSIVFTEKQVEQLNGKLDTRLVSTRKGGGNISLKYIEGHDAIDQANRIFGYGNWAYRPLSCEQKVLQDPMTGEAIGVSYKAQVELTVRGCVAPIVEVGSQPVATWNIEDQIMKRRISDAKYNKKPVNEGEFTSFEKTNARAVIAEAHEMAEKGAVTDALKRALRTFGDQFGNGLYGDGRVTGLDAPESDNAMATVAAKDAASCEMITEEQITAITNLSKHLKREVPADLAAKSFKVAETMLKQLRGVYATNRTPSTKPSQQNVSTPVLSSTNAPDIKALRGRCNALYGVGKWEELVTSTLKSNKPDDNITPEDRSLLKRAMDITFEERNKAKEKESGGAVLLIS